MKLKLGGGDAYVYVGIGWRFLYETGGMLSADSLEVEHKVRLQLYWPVQEDSTERTASLGSRKSAEKCIKLLDDCRTAAKAKKIMKGEVGGFRASSTDAGKVLLSIDGTEESPYIVVVFDPEDAGKFIESFRQVNAFEDKMNARLAMNDEKSKGK